MDIDAFTYARTTLVAEIEAKRAQAMAARPGPQDKMGTDEYYRACKETLQYAGDCLRTVAATAEAITALRKRLERDADKAHTLEVGSQHDMGIEEYYRGKHASLIFALAQLRQLEEHV